jgi:putative oxidoreductase
MEILPMAVATSPVPTRYRIPALASFYEGLAPLAEALARVTAGLCLVPHGAQKLFGAFGGGGLAGTAQFLGQAGYEPGWLWAVLLALTEFAGGLLLAVGLLTRPAAAAIFLFLVTATVHHLPRGFFWNEGGFEYPLLWAVVALLFVIRGGGCYSVDGALRREF